MPKRRSSPTLVSECLRVICSSINWFALRQSQFDCLTSDLVGQIFNRLKTNPGLAIRHFQLVVTDHLNHIDLSSPYQHYGGDLYMDVALDIIRVRQPNLIRIDMSNVLRIPDLFWSIILPAMTNLRVINLRSTNCGDQEVLTIVKHCPNLRELDLSLCERVTNWSVSNLSQEPGGMQLQHLDVMQTQVDERGIRSVVHCCPSLRSLKWRNTINVLGQIYRDLSGNNRSLMESPSFSLHQLISDSSYRLYSLQGAAQLCSQAVQVTIDGPSQLPAEELQALEHLHSLRELHVVLGSYCSPGHQLDFRQGFDAILLKHGSSLRHLSLGRIRNVDLERIARYCRQLSSLSLELNHSYFTETEMTCSIRSLAKLHVTIRDREPYDENESCHDVPGTCLAALMASPSIRQIKITACQTINDQVLLESVFGHNLESLELESCSNISMQSLWSVISRSKHLSNLKIYRCRLVNDRDIAELDTTIEDQHWDLDLDYYCDDS